MLASLANVNVVRYDVHFGPVNFLLISFLSNSCYDEEYF